MPTGFAAWWVTRPARTTDGLNAKTGAVCEEDLSAGGDGARPDSDGAGASEAGVVWFPCRGMVYHADGVRSLVGCGVVEAADLGGVGGASVRERARNSALVSTKVEVV